MSNIKLVHKKTDSSVDYAGYKRSWMNIESAPEHGSVSSKHGICSFDIYQVDYDFKGVKYVQTRWTLELQCIANGRRHIREYHIKKPSWRTVVLLARRMLRDLA